MKNNRLFATFTDSQLEKEFIEHEMESALKYLRPGVLVLGILFFLFIIPDYFLTHSTQVFRIILAIRFVFLLLVIFFLIMPGKKDVQSSLRNWVSFYTLTVTVFYLLIIHRHEAPGRASPFFVQSLAVVVLILIFFSFNSHWLHMVAISAFLSAVFFDHFLLPMGGYPLAGVCRCYRLLSASINDQQHFGLPDHYLCTDVVHQQA
jgi:hypothetical protein